MYPLFMNVQTLLPILIFLLFAFGFSFTVNFIFYRRLEDERNYRLFHLGLKKPFKKVKKIMTSEESKLFSVLSNLENLKKFSVYPQIPYSAIIEVDPEIADLGGRFEKINEYRADFVVADKNDHSPILVIELNDSTHKYKNRRARDYFIKSAMDSCNTPILFLDIKDIPNSEKIAKAIEDKLNC